MKQRNVSLDVIRCIALFLVVSLHFFYLNGFSNEFLNNPKMYVITIFRDFCLVCVPLFLMLSGYLCCTKTLSKGYYKGIVKTYSIYIFSNVLYLLYEMIWKKVPFSFSKLFFGILDFSTLSYSWYVKMYIGLFLLIPFLNLIYNNLTSKKQKHILIITGLFMAAVPYVVNIYNITLVGWWKNPTMSSEYQPLLPDAWTELGAVSYYFIGCYLKEYSLKMSRRKNIVLLLLATVLLGSYDFYRTRPYCHMAGVWQDNDSLFVVCVAVLLFHLLLHIPFEKIHPKCQNLLACMSNLCFGAYLVSAIFDEIIYGIIDGYGDGLISKCKLFILVVPIIYLCSLMTSWFMNTIYQYMFKIPKVFMHKKKI